MLTVKHTKTSNNLHGTGEPYYSVPVAARRVEDHTSQRCRREVARGVEQGQQT